MDKTAVTEYPVNELIARRWSPRAFEPKPVPDAHLRSVLEAARWAASSFNEQPWRFLVARRQDTEEFERMLGCLMEGNQTWARNAGALILTACSTTFSRNGNPNRVALHDLGQAAAHIALQAAELGLVVHQMGGVHLDRIRESYGIPEGFEPQTGIAVGYEGEASTLPDELRKMEESPRRRAPQGELVFAGSWGEAASW